MLCLRPGLFLVHTSRRSTRSLSHSSSLPSTPLHPPQGPHTTTPPEVRLRFAPSPTGALHLGGLRTALFNHLLSRVLPLSTSPSSSSSTPTRGKWILRIEDTDQARTVPGAAAQIEAALAWAGLVPDESPLRGGPHAPYVQSERLTLYRAAAQTLLSSGHAYADFRSEDELERARQTMFELGFRETFTRVGGLLPPHEQARRLAAGHPHVVRWKDPLKQVHVHDAVYGQIAFLPRPEQTPDDKVLLKSDSRPTYHLAAVVDDHAMRISHVVRGEEWLLSTALHLQLADALAYPRPTYIHLPLIMNPDGSKLSKRSGHVSVRDFQEKGYEPAALVNFLALMGWSRANLQPEPLNLSPEQQKDLLGDGRHRKQSAGVCFNDHYTLPYLESHFSLQDILPRRSTMDVLKLDSVNKAHLRLALLDPAMRSQLIERFKSLLVRQWPPTANPDLTQDDATILAVLHAIVPRVTKLRDVLEMAPYFFVGPDLRSAAAVEYYHTLNHDAYPRVLQILLDNLHCIDMTNHDAIRQSLSSIRKQHDIAGSTFFSVLRHALTGRAVGTTTTTTIHIMGARKVTVAFQNALAYHSELQTSQASNTAVSDKKLQDT